MKRGLLVAPVAIAMFRSPLVAALSYLHLRDLGSLLPEISLGALIFHTYLCRSRTSRPGIWDYCMFAWLAYFPLAYTSSYALSGNAIEVLQLTRHFFMIPVAFFIYRGALQSHEEASILIGDIQGLLKLALVYICIELVLVQFWREELEVLFAAGGPKVRLFDGMANLWVKPAGPIHGSQNASILCLIALFGFIEVNWRGRLRVSKSWIVLAGTLLLASLTITALVVGGVYIFLRSLLSSDPRVRRVIPFAAVLSCLVAMAYWKEIVSLRVAGVTDRDFHEIYSEAGVRSVDSFMQMVRTQPMGFGWPSLQSRPEQLRSAMLWEQAPPEVFLLRLGFFLGLPICLGLMAMHGWLGWVIRRHRRQLAVSGEIIWAFQVVILIFLSTIHYESFTAPGFAYLYAVSFALLSTLPTQANEVETE